jgi:hypothetical protein
MHFRLTNNIDLEGNKENQWAPIGTVEHPFKGHFNGNHFEITNLYVENYTTDYTGLFGYVHEGSIENTGISEQGFIVGKNNVGGIVGYQMSGNIYNCYNKTSVHGENNVGGIVGYQYSVNVKSCFNMGDVNGKWYIGGIMGTAYANSHVCHCFNTGNIRGENYVGGIAGKVDGYNHKASLTNCYQESLFNKIGLIGIGISVECSNCYYTDVAGMKQATYGTPLTNKEMAANSFFMKLTGTENTWTPDKEPCINSGYPILASIKYRGVFTNEATDITDESAILQGNFIGKDETVLQRGFEYRAKDSLQFTTVFVDSDSFSYNLTPLISYMTYEFVAFVITDKGKIRGRNVEFRTLNKHHHHHDDHQHILDHTH